MERVSIDKKAVEKWRMQIKSHLMPLYVAHLPDDIDVNDFKHWWYRKSSTPLEKEVQSLWLEGMPTTAGLNFIEEVINDTFQRFYLRSLD